jgi:hypothetical protein
MAELSFYTTKVTKITPVNLDQSLVFYNKPKKTSLPDIDSSLFMISTMEGRPPGDLNSDIFFYSQVVAGERKRRMVSFF